MSEILKTLKFLGSSWLEVAVAVDEQLETQSARIAELEAALATARQDALALIMQDTDELIEQGRKDGMEYAAQIADNYANRNHVSLNIGVAIRAALEGKKE